MEKFIKNVLTSMDVNQFKTFVQVHNVECYVYNQLKNTDDDEVSGVREAIKESSYRMAFVMKSIINQAIDTVNFMNRLGVEYRVLKGCALVGYYEKSFFRSMSDIDIWVNKRDLNHVVEAFKKEGYFPDANAMGGKDIKLCKPGHLSIELHHALFSEGVFEFDKKVMQEFWSEKHYVTYEGTEMVTLTPENHFKYLMLHKLVHMKHSGFGVKQLLDLVHMVNVLKMDVKDYYPYFKALKIEYFYCAVIALCETYFGMKRFYDGVMPIDANPQEMELFFEWIVDNGAFGNHSEALKVRAIKTQIFKGYHKKSVLPPLVYGIFPRSKDLTLRYSYAKKNPVLLPLAWAHRWVYYVFRKDISSEVKLFFIKNRKDFNKKEFLLKSLRVE